MAGIADDSEEFLSDLPLMHRVHHKSGYRDGLTRGREQSVQAGFDAGYRSGTELGSRIGHVLGVLDGFLQARVSGGLEVDDQLSELKRAEQELSIDTNLAELEGCGSVLSHGDRYSEQDVQQRLAAFEKILSRWEDLVSSRLRLAAVGEKP